MSDWTIRLGIDGELTSAQINAIKNFYLNNKAIFSHVLAIRHDQKAIDITVDLDE